MFLKESHSRHEAARLPQLQDHLDAVKAHCLYLMGLLERPCYGKIFMDDVEVQDLSDKERTHARNQRIGFVFQFHFLIKELTALENVRLPLPKETAPVA